MRRRRAFLAGIMCAVGACATLAAGPPAAAATPKPVVVKLSATSGPLAGGTEVIVTGKFFTKVAKVLFGSAAGSGLKVLSSTRLQVTAPKHAADSVNVQVVAKAGTSMAVPADRFTFVAPPSIAIVSPPAGPPAGGTRVTITGSNFTKVSKVLFGTKPGTSLSLAARGKILVTAPPEKDGQVDVRVVSAYGTSAVVKADHYTYYTSHCPQPDGEPLRCKLTTG